MEGSYNKVFLARFNVPAESYLFFIDILLDTIRGQIASCISASYSSVTVAEATKLLFCDNQSKTKQFADKQGWEGDGKVYRWVTGSLLDIGYWVVVLTSSITASGTEH